VLWRSSVVGDDVEGLSMADPMLVGVIFWRFSKIWTLTLYQDTGLY